MPPNIIQWILEARGGAAAAADVEKVERQYKKNEEQIRKTGRAYKGLSDAERQAAEISRQTAALKGGALEKELLLIEKNKAALAQLAAMRAQTASQSWAPLSGHLEPYMTAQGLPQVAAIAARNAAKYDNWLQLTGRRESLAMAGERPDWPSPPPLSAYGLPADQAKLIEANVGVTRTTKDATKATADYSDAQAKAGKHATEHGKATLGAAGKVISLMAAYAGLRTVVDIIKTAYAETEKLADKTGELVQSLVPLAGLAGPGLSTEAIIAATEAGKAEGVRPKVAQDAFQIMMSKVEPALRQRGASNQEILEKSAEYSQEAFRLMKLGVEPAAAMEAISKAPLFGKSAGQMSALVHSAGEASVLTTAQIAETAPFWIGYSSPEMGAAMSAAISGAAPQEELSTWVKGAAKGLGQLDILPGEKAKTKAQKTAERLGLHGMSETEKLEAIRRDLRARGVEPENEELKRMGFEDVREIHPIAAILKMGMVGDIERMRQGFGRVSPTLAQDEIADIARTTPIVAEQWERERVGAATEAGELLGTRGVAAQRTQREREELSKWMREQGKSWRWEYEETSTGGLRADPIKHGIGNYLRLMGFRPTSPPPEPGTVPGYEGLGPKGEVIVGERMEKAADKLDKSAENLRSATADWRRENAAHPRNSRVE